MVLPGIPATLWRKTMDAASAIDASDVSADACRLPQPRLTPIALSPEVPAGARPLLEQFGHAPGLIEGWLQWYQPLVMGGRVPTRTKELVRLAVARRTGCHLCQNSRFGDPTGVGPAVEAGTAAAVLADDWSRCTPAEQAALAYTVAFWDDHADVGDEVIDRVRDAYGTDGFLEIALAVAQFSGMGRLFQMLGITAPEGP
jgi:alkylhydroperoxidase family enzyme